MRLRWLVLGLRLGRSVVERKCKMMNLEFQFTWCELCISGIAVMN